MKKLFHAFIFFTLTSMAISADLNPLIALSGVIASNWHALEMHKEALQANKHCSEIIKNPNNCLSNQPDYTESLNKILNRYNTTKKDVLFYQDKSLSTQYGPMAYEWKNKIFVNERMVNALKKDTIQEYDQRVTDVALGHEIDHALNKTAVFKAGMFRDILNSFSNIVLYQTFNTILESDLHPVIKCCSIPAIAAAKYFVDKSSFTMIARQNEKHADLHAAKHTKNPAHFKSFLQFCNTIPQEDSRIFARHPHKNQRKIVFQQAFDKLEKVD